MFQIINEFFQQNFMTLFKIIGLIVLGLFTGWFIKKITINISRITGLTARVDKGALGHTLKEAGYRGNLSRIIASLLQWFVYLLFLMIIMRMLGFPEIYSFISKIIFFIPKLAVALVLVVLGWIISEFFGRVVYEVLNKGLESVQSKVVNKAIAKVVQVIFGLVFFIMAFQLLGIEATTLMIIFTIVLVALLALFVLGIKETIPNIMAGLNLGTAGLKRGSTIQIESVKAKVIEVGGLVTTLDIKGDLVVMQNKKLFEKELKIIRS